jgi:tetratricopeptide (TPR) repeat protein
MAINQQSQSLLLKAREAKKNNTIDLAINFYEQFLKKNKYAEDIRYELATFLAVHKRTKEAITEFKTLLKNNSQNAFLNANLGTAHAESGKPEEAINYFKQALEINPNLVALYIPMAECNRQIKRFDLALKLLKQSLDIQPGHHEAYCIMGLTYFDMKELPKSLECFERAIDLAPNLADYRVHFAKALVEVGFSTEAKNQIETALMISPNVNEVKYFLVEVLDKRRQFFEAIDYLKTWNKLQPEDFKIHKLLCSLYFKVNKINEAKFHLDLLIKAKPDDIAIKIHKVKFLEKNNQPLEARKEMSELIKNYSKEAAIIELAREKNLLAEIEPKIIQHHFNFSKQLSVNDEIKKNFLMGEYYDARKEWDKAFECFSIANNIKNKYYAPHVNDFFAKEEEKINHIREFLKQKPDDINLKPINIKPIFIVGMSRAGKTWLENLLSKSGIINSADEIRVDFYKPEEILKKIKSNSGFNEEQHLEDLTVVREKYLKEIELYAEGTEAKYVISTLPAHGYDLGKINQIFPDAPIIYSQRDPLDVIIFNYFKIYRHDTAYAYNLDSIAQYYLIYQKMMNLWIEKIPKKIIQFKFEDSVNNPLNSFYEIMSMMNMKVQISNAQEQQILDEASQYKSSIGHWKNYEKYLGDIVSQKLKA